MDSNLKTRGSVVEDPTQNSTIRFCVAKPSQMSVFEDTETELMCYYKWQFTFGSFTWALATELAESAASCWCRPADPINHSNKQKSPTPWAERPYLETLNAQQK